jgi:hypothetical protein
VPTWMSHNFEVPQAMNLSVARYVRVQPFQRRAALGLFVFLAYMATAGSSYGQTSLCKPDEQTIWSCNKGEKAYSVCASGDLGSSSGYMQYRAGKSSDIELIYPKDLEHPKGVFVFSIQPRGTSLAFENEGFEYIVYESIMGDTTITVIQAGRERASIQCDASTETLTLTTTINQLKAVGIVE